MMIKKNNILRILIVIFFCLNIYYTDNVIAETYIKGEIIAGGIILVNSFPGASVKLDGTSLMVSDDGLFIIGFEREPKLIQILEIIKDNLTIEKITLNIKKRSYKIQRIDGLDENKVDPPQSLIDRIFRERKKVGESRKQAEFINKNYYSNGFNYPAKGPISGVYGSQRILNGKPKSPHYGIDIALPKGHNVSAPMDGIVLFTNNDLYFSGGTIIVGHGQGLTTSYLHLSKILVKENDIIKRGQLIAKVGATGRTTGPHLHWGAEWNGIRIDPQYLKIFN